MGFMGMGEVAVKKAFLMNLQSCIGVAPSVAGDDRHAVSSHMFDPDPPPRLSQAMFRGAVQSWWSDSPALLIGTVAWLLVMALYWPEGLSFEDDVGYVGEAKLLLTGRILPRTEDPGVWTHTVHGLVPQYPLLLSLLLVPFLAIAPRAVFAVGILAAVAICWTAARALKVWGSNPAWALLLLAHPTVVIIARTATADIPLAAFTLGAWWALRRNRRGPAVLLFAAMFAIKPTGLLLGFAIVVGEWLRMLPALRERDTEARSRVVTSLLSIAAGFALIFATNELTAGQMWFAYDHRFLGTPPFWFSYFGKTAPAHLRTVVLFPPLLILGALPYWRRREVGPLCLIFGFGTLMCFYFFVDFGTTWVESFVLSPRLLLPAVVFLLIGYADLLATAVRRFESADRWLGLVLIVGTASVALVVSIRHSHWQAPMAQARRAAEQIARQVDSRELGLTPQAVKAGLLFPGPTPVVSIVDTEVAVVLCSSRSASYRARNDGGNYSCAVPGYQADYRAGDFEVLVRAPSAGGLEKKNDLLRKQ
jgi:hypothetical protein